MPLTVRLMSVVKGPRNNYLPLPRKQRVLFRVECIEPAVKTLDDG
jgi:hypothetical protein